MSSTSLAPVQHHVFYGRDTKDGVMKYWGREPTVHRDEVPLRGEAHTTARAGTPP
jgi:hypothetical protein